VLNESTPFWWIVCMIQVSPASRIRRLSDSMKVPFLPSCEEIETLSLPARLLQPWIRTALSLRANPLGSCLRRFPTWNVNIGQRAIH
jgi:hypothetical protein